MPSIINSDDGVVSGSAGLKTTGGNDGILALQNNGTTNVTVTAAGNVGIGTSSPSSPFQVHRDSVSFVNIKVSNSVTGSGTLDGVDLVCGTSGEAYLYNRENQPLIFGTNNTEQARITAAGLFQFNSGYGSVATAYGCRAWVNFNGTGTVAIRASGNVTSITDNGTGDYTVNFTNALVDANYSSAITSDNTNAAVLAFGADAATARTTTALRLRTANTSGTLTDAGVISVAIFR